MKKEKSREQLEAELKNVRAKKMKLHYEDAGVVYALSESEKLTELLSARTSKLCEQFNNLLTKEEKLEKLLGQ